MNLPTALATATLLALGFSCTRSQPHSPETTTPPVIVKTLTINEENAFLLKKLKDYQDLEALSIVCVESLQDIPDDIGQLGRLRELNLNNGNGCAMNPRLPESLGKLHALENLDLYGGQDPSPVGDHYGPQPTQRHPFPKSMSQLTNLRYLDLRRNGLDEIPDFVKDLPNLKELGFDWNMQIKGLPRFLANLPELQTLRLNSDGLTDVPQFLSKAPKLSLITLGNNCSITTSESKKNALQHRFPSIKLDFEDEYDCPTK